MQSTSKVNSGLTGISKIFPCFTTKQRSAFFPPHFHTSSHLRQNVQYVDYGHYSKFSQMHPGFPLRGPNRENQARSILRMGNKIYFIRLTVTSIYSKNAAV